MTVTHKINMDLARRGVIPRIDVVQEDKYSRVLEFSLYAEGIEWTPPANAEIVVRYERPDGKVGNYTALITDEAAGMISGNTVSVTLAPLILAVAGIAKVAVGLVDGDVEITTFLAEIKIQKNPGAAAAASSTFGDATVSDVAAGKTFTSDSGQGTGTLEEIASGKSFANSGGDVLYIEGSDVVSPFFIARKTVPADKIVRKDAVVSVNVDASKMGDATAPDVLAGKTFTSKNGLRITGALVAEGGIDTSGATATAADLPEGLIAFANGEKIIGTMKTIAPVVGTLGEESGYITIQRDYAENRYVPAGGTLKQLAQPGSFGDATPGDVAAGKTFTSTAGLKVLGTREDSGLLVKKTGTTVSNVIDTGLSSINFIVIYKESVSATGLVQAQFDGESSYFIYCLSYSTTIKNFTVGTSAYGSAEGGVFTWGGTGNTALTEGVTYNWIAYGSK